tara:strand:+ start:30418 stop:31575 length:1158 start_codon:yes stop_codon:yes gene_type:complete
MIDPKPENYIVKYLCNEATSTDLDWLSHWISKEGNIKIFEEYIQTHYEINTAMNKPDVDKIKRTLMRDIRRDKKLANIYNFNDLFKYAAVILIIIGGGYLYLQDNIKPTTDDVLAPKNEPITITLNNGTTEIILPEENKQFKNANGEVIGKQNDSRLTYSRTVHENELTYNTLKVPYGKRFDVVLSDGTHIYLNSGTTIQYPVNFIKGHDRKVSLTGEAYFEVAKDENHPFVVEMGNLKLEVLGTVFNASHYPEDTSTSTVLVEGSVKIYHGKDPTGKRNSTLLRPGVRAEWNNKNETISLENVDVAIYTAWVHGKLVFRNTSFLKIRQVLERKYNVTIKNADSALDNQLFNATFDIETIEEVLESFSKSYALKYSIKNNEVIID